MRAKIYLPTDQGCYSPSPCLLLQRNRSVRSGMPTAKFTLGVTFLGVGCEVLTPAVVCGASASLAGWSRNSAWATANRGSSQSSRPRLAVLFSASRFSKNKPRSPEGTGQTNTEGTGGRLGWGGPRAPEGLPALLGRVGRGWLPREKKNKSWLGLISACEHFHTTSAALN